MYITNALIKGYNRDADTARLLNEFEFYIIPVSNPDGYEFSRNSQRFWRKNRSGSGACRGVDLNRNWGQEWGGQGSSGRRCSDTYRGTKAFSEKETNNMAIEMMKRKGVIKMF